MTTKVRTKAQTITYYYRGLIERGPRYEWREGYSENSTEGHPIYPWSTKRECQQAAKRQGAKAVFIHDKTQQIA